MKKLTEDLKGRHFKLRSGDQVYEATGRVRERGGHTFYEIIRKYTIYGKPVSDYLLMDELDETGEPLTPLPSMPSLLTNATEKRDGNLTGKHYTVEASSSDWVGTGFYKDTKIGRYIQVVDEQNHKAYLPEDMLDIKKSERKAMLRIRLTDIIKTAALDAHAAVLMAHTKPSSIPTLLDAAGKIRGYQSDLTPENVDHVLDLTGLKLRSSSPMALENLHRNLMKVRIAGITERLDTLSAKLASLNYPVLSDALDNVSDTLEGIVSEDKSIGVQDILKSPLAEAYGITLKDLNDAKELLKSRTATNEKYLEDIPDKKIAVALLLALTLATGVGHFHKDTVVKMKPGDKRVKEYIDKSKKMDPIQSVKNFFSKLVQDEKKVRTEGITPNMDKAIVDVAKKLNVKNPEWLKKVILFESRGNPGIKNPNSSARGLIQFMNSSAREMGYKDSEDLIKKHPTDVGQLAGPVYDYLKRYAPFPTEQSLYMAVFYPKYRYENPDRVFPRRVRKANPGIRKIQDYVDLVNRVK